MAESVPLAAGGKGKMALQCIIGLVTWCVRMPATELQPFCVWYNKAVRCRYCSVYPERAA
jgi:hypothetical protein